MEPIINHEGIQYPMIAQFVSRQKKPLSCIDFEGCMHYGFQRQHRFVQAASLSFFLNQDRPKVFNSLIHPECPIDRYSTEVHGITSKDVKDSPIWNDVATYFSDIANHHLILGMNLCSFDLRVLCLEQARIGHPLKQPIHYLDIRNLWGQKRGTLKDLAHYYGIAEQFDWHSALSDARATALVFECMLQEKGCAWAESFMKYYESPAMIQAHDSGFRVPEQMSLAF